MTESNDPMYSCITCRLLVSCPQSQREHYHTDWHRYNLKRKVANLLPVSLDTFLEKASAQNALLLAADSVRQTTWKCDVCRKYFSSQNQLQNHLSSKRHKAATLSLNTAQPAIETNASEKLDTSTGDDIEEVSDPVPLEANECLFCPFHSTDRPSHLRHMYLFHGFFIPYYDYVQDFTGILQLLATQVGEHYGCVYCVNRYFTSVEAAQHHMMDKSHCKLNPDDSELFCDLFSAFYDFSTSYPDQDQASSSDPPSDTGLKISEDMSLILPSGATVGHRAFRHIYKQNLRPSASRSLVLAKPPTSNGADYLMKLRCIRETKRVLAQKNKYEMRLGIKANKLQPYLRKQC